MTTERRMELRRKHFARLEVKKVDKLIKKYNKTKSLGLANYLHQTYGIGDFGSKHFSQ